MRRKGENVFRMCFYRALIKHRESPYFRATAKKHKHTSKRAKCFYIGGRKDGCWEVRTGNQ
jgi:hypothetical protein